MSLCAGRAGGGADAGGQHGPPAAQRGPPGVPPWARRPGPSASCFSPRSRDRARPLPFPVPADPTPQGPKRAGLSPGTGAAGRRGRGRGRGARLSRARAPRPGLLPSMAGPAAAALAEARGRGLQQASTAPTRSGPRTLPGRSPLPAAGPSRERTAAGARAAALPWRPRGPRGAAASVRQSGARPRGAGARPERRGWAHLWGFAAANPDPGKVKGRRAAGGVRSREGLGGAGRPASAHAACAESSPMTVPQDSLRPWTYPCLGKWSDPSLSSYHFILNQGRQTKDGSSARDSVNRRSN